MVFNWVSKVVKQLLWFWFRFLTLTRFETGSNIPMRCTGIAEVTGSNPVEALIFSGFSFPIA